MHLGTDDWAILRDLRMRALADSPDCFAGSLAEESRFTEEEWRNWVQAQEWFAVVEEGDPIALMGIDVVTRNGCNCWVHGVWVDPTRRGRGLTRVMVEWLDQLSQERQWVRQGLGVWPENIRAIEVWERLGFQLSGTPQPSMRRPGQYYVAMQRDVPAYAVAS